MIVTIQHLHSIPTWTGRQGFCHRQARAFVERQGWDWLTFVREGIDAQLLLDTGEALAIALVEHARQEAAYGR